MAGDTEVSAAHHSHPSPAWCRIRLTPTSEKHEKSLRKHSLKKGQFGLEQSSANFLERARQELFLALQSYIQCLLQWFNSALVTGKSLQMTCEGRVWLCAPPPSDHSFLTRRAPQPVVC